MQVLNYSGLDDTLYVAWGGSEPADRQMGAVPRGVVMDEDPTPLGNRLRALGVDLEPCQDSQIAEKLRNEYTDRFGKSAN